MTTDEGIPLPEDVREAVMELRHWQEHVKFGMSAIDAVVLPAADLLERESRLRLTAEATIERLRSGYQATIDSYAQKAQEDFGKVAKAYEAQLTAERERDEARYDHKAAVNRADDAESRCTTLEQALRTYGQHLQDCQLNKAVPWCRVVQDEHSGGIYGLSHDERAAIKASYRCTCGLEALRTTEEALTASHPTPQ